MEPHIGGGEHMKKQSLVGGFRMTVTWIAVASIVATLITWSLAAALYLMEQNRGIYPANYYELQIPSIDQYVRSENTRLLSQENEMGLKNSIEGDGVSYQVVDSSAAVLYGTNTEPIFSSEADLINHLNTTEVYSDKNTYLHVIPLTGEDGKMEGAVALVYEVKISASGSGGRSSPLSDGGAGARSNPGKGPERHFARKAAEMSGTGSRSCSGRAWQ